MTKESLWDRMSMERFLKDGKFFWRFTSERTGKVILGLTRGELLELFIAIQVEVRDSTSNTDLTRKHC